MDLLCRKGFYPHEFVDSDDKLNYPELPPKESFCSKLSQANKSDQNYLHAQNVYDKLNCRSFKDYHSTYLQCEVLILADVLKTLGKPVKAIMVLILQIIFLLQVWLGTQCF